MDFIKNFYKIPTFNLLNGFYLIKYFYTDNLHNAAYSPLDQFIQLLMPYGVPNPLDDDGTGEVKTNEDDEAQDESQKPDQLELVHCMMDAGFDASVRAIQGETPLHLAASAGSNWCVSILLSLFGKVGIVDNNLRTPLHYAVQEDKPQVITTLVNAGCNIDAKDIDGNAPIHYAASKNAVECIKMLHSLNANINAKNAIGISFIVL